MPYLIPLAAKSFTNPSRNRDILDKLLIKGTNSNITMFTVQGAPNQAQNIVSLQRYGGLQCAAFDKNGSLTIGGTDPLAVATTTLTINCYSISNGSSFTSTIATDAGGSLILTNGGGGNGNMQCTNGTIYFGLGNSGQATQNAFIVSATSLGRSPTLCYIHSSKTLWIGASDTNNFGPTEGGTPGTGTISAMQGGGTDITGGTLTISAGQGTGVGPSGNMLFKVSAPAGSTSSALNTLSTVVTVSPTSINHLISAISATVIPGAIKLAASHTADAWQILKSDGTTIYYGNDKLGRPYTKNTTPTIAAGAGAGTAPTVSVTGTDVNGLVNVTSGTLPTGSAIVATISFSATFSTAPKTVLLTPANANAAALNALTMVWVDSGGLGTGSWTINAGATGLGAATAYSWYYQVLG